MLKKNIQLLKTKPPVVRNSIMAALLFLIALPGYLVINALYSVENPIHFHLFLDDQIPFLPWSISIYYWIYILIFLPIFMIRDFELFLAGSKAYSLGILISFVFFLILPARIEQPQISEVKNFFDWWLLLNYTIDKPTALFPSMHVSNAFLSSIVILPWSKKVGYPANLFSFCICISTLTVKQHFLADVVAGFLVGLLSYFIFVFPVVRKKVNQPKEEILMPESFSFFVLSIGLSLTFILFLVYTFFGKYILKIL